MLAVNALCRPAFLSLTVLEAALPLVFGPRRTSFAFGGGRFTIVEAADEDGEVSVVKLSRTRCLRARGPGLAGTMPWR